MRAAIVGALLAALASLGQNTPSKPTVVQELPQERVPDTYSVYEASLHNPVADHNGDPHGYFISDRTGQTYGVADPDKCIDAPEADRRALQQAVADFRAQNGNVYRIVNRFNLNGRKVRLLNEVEEKQVEARLFDRKTRLQPMLADATDIIRLSRVGFNNDRSLAIVVVSNYCGGLCGSERWRIFKRSKGEWVEQHWNRCEVVS